MSQVLTVIRPGETAPERFARTLEAALEGRRAQVRPRLEGALKDCRVLFAVSLDGSGVNPEFCALLAYLRTHPGCLRGCVGGVRRFLRKRKTFAIQRTMLSWSHC